MSIAPIFTSPCDLAERIPALIADFLDLENSLQRRFREESISDIFVASLIQLRNPDIVVSLPKDESKTGNDFDIVIVDAAAREAVQYRIQAKRLSPHPTEWGKGSYRELAHPGGTGSQSSSLIRSSAAERGILTIPLYAFYNPSRTCAASGDQVSGIEMADGRTIRLIVQLLIALKPKRRPLKRISTLHPFFFPLTSLFCPDAGSIEPSLKISSAAASLHRVTRALEATAINSLDRYLSHQQVEIPRRRLADLRLNHEKYRSKTLALTENLPKFLQQAFDRRGTTASDRVIYSSVKQPRVIVFSG